MKRALPFCLTLLLLLAFFPLSGQESLKPFVFTPQWTPQAQFAGYYAALEKGFYREEGLDVKIVHPSSTSSAMDRIIGNQSDATTLQLAQALELVDSGIELVHILQTSMNNGLVLVSRTDVSPLTLTGARVATWRAGFAQIAECMSAELNLEYEWIQAAEIINLYVVGAVDATLAMSYNEYYQLLQTDLIPSENSVYRFSEHGFNIQEDGIYMSRSAYRKDPDRAQRFARASRRGWEWVRDNPEEALDIVMNYVKRGNTATNRILQKKMLDEVLRLQLDQKSGRPEFRLVPAMVDQASDLMYRNGMLKRPIKIEEILP